VVDKAAKLLVLALWRRASFMRWLVTTANGLVVSLTHNLMGKQPLGREKDNVLPSLAETWADNWAFVASFWSGISVFNT
jgi:hypothetical protein